MTLKRFASLLIVSFVFAACTSQNTAVATHPIGFKAPTVTLTASPSATLTVSPTATITNTPLPSKIPTRTKIPTETLAPAWTPLPAIEHSVAVVETLMVNNGGCRLPCWWGITPGETSWNEARQFLESFNGYVERDFDHRLSTAPGSFEFFVSFHNPGTDGRNTATINVRQGDVQIIWVEAGATIRDFQYNQLLTEYGPPDSLMIKRDDVYYLGMFFDEEQFLAEYFIEIDRSVEPTLACFSPFGPNITSWAETEGYIRAQSIFSNDSYRPVEDTTSFYERFRFRLDEPCFELSY